MKKVILNETEVYFDACVAMMDDDIREELHSKGIEDEQELLDRYAELHEQKYGETFEII